jgi:hypothetical protein
MSSSKNTFLDPEGRHSGEQNAAVAAAAVTVNSMRRPGWGTHACTQAAAAVYLHVYVHHVATSSRERAEKTAMATNENRRKNNEQ